MTSDRLPPPAGRDRPFPWRCVECGAKAVFPERTEYTRTVKHDGRGYRVHIPDLEIPTCRECGEKVFSARVDDRIMAALRQQVGLLPPEEIKKRREQLDLSQQQMAEQVGVAKESISRWETGAMIQSRAIDNLLRLFFESQEARDLLQRKFNPKPPKPPNRIWPKPRYSSTEEVEKTAREEFELLRN